MPTRGKEFCKVLSSEIESLPLESERLSWKRDNKQNESIK